LETGKDCDLEEKLGSKNNRKRIPTRRNPKKGGDERGGPLNLGAGLSWDPWVRVAGWEGCLKKVEKFTLVGGRRGVQTGGIRNAMKVTSS